MSENPRIHPLQRAGAIASILSCIVAAVLIAPLTWWTFFHPSHPNSARHQTLQALNGFYVELDKLYIRGNFLSPQSSEKDYQAFAADVEETCERARNWISRNMDPAAAARLTQLDPSLVNVQFKNQRNDDHRATLIAIHSIRLAIAALIISPSFDKR